MSQTMLALAAVLAAVVTVVAATQLRRRHGSSTARRSDDPAGGDVSEHETAQDDGDPRRRRSLPRHVTLEQLSLEAPPPGRALVVLFSTSECSACLPARRRLDRIEHADVVEIDLTDSPEAAAELGIDGVPALLVYGGDGQLVRSWIGEPLAFTLERAVADAATRTQE